MTLINTIYGEIPLSALDKKTGIIESDVEYTTWTEYQIKGYDEIVHRSCHVQLKESLTTNINIGQ